MATRVDCHPSSIVIWLSAVDGPSKYLLGLLAIPQAKGCRLLYVPPTKVYAFRHCLTAVVFERLDSIRLIALERGSFSEHHSVGVPINGSLFHLILAIDFGWKPHAICQEPRILRPAPKNQLWTSSSVLLWIQEFNVQNRCREQRLSPASSVCDNSLKFKVFCEFCDVVCFFDATIHFIFASARIFIISLTLLNECKADGYSTTPLCGHLIPR
jgi:hypothetical protein